MHFAGNYLSIDYRNFKHVDKILNLCFSKQTIKLNSLFPRFLLTLQLTKIFPQYTTKTAKGKNHDNTYYYKKISKYEHEDKRKKRCTFVSFLSQVYFSSTKLSSSWRQNVIWRMQFIHSSTVSLNSSRRISSYSLDSCPDSECIPINCSYCPLNSYNALNTRFFLAVIREFLVVLLYRSTESYIQNIYIYHFYHLRTDCGWTKQYKFVYYYQFTPFWTLIRRII